MTAYLDFLRAKMKVADATGFDVDDTEINPDLAPHCRAIVKWALQGGRRGIFAAFGLHKTSIQLELMRLIGKHVGGRRLIVLPLGVRHEFFAEAEERFRGEFSVNLRFIRRDDEVTDDDVVHVANYESVRDGKIDPLQFDIVDRLIDRYSNPGDVVYDPFGGLMTVPYRAIMKGRYGMASELNEVSFRDGAFYCRDAEAKRNVPSLFDLLDAPPIEPSMDDLTSEAAQ